MFGNQQGLRSPNAAIIDSMLLAGSAIVALSVLELCVDDDVIGRLRDCKVLSIYPLQNQMQAAKT